MNEKPRCDAREPDETKQFQVTGDSDQATQNLPVTSPKTSTSGGSSEPESPEKND
jgi:hypothetical protein